MQEVQFGVSMPSILILGFLIGVILIILGYRERQDLVRRNHQIGLGTIIVGIMIPVTPLSWYIYWEGFLGLFMLPLEHKLVIILALVIGLAFIVHGARIYRRPQ